MALAVPLELPFKAGELPGNWTPWILTIWAAFFVPVVDTAVAVGFGSDSISEQTCNSITLRIGRCHGIAIDSFSSH